MTPVFVFTFQDAVGLAVLALILIAYLMVYINKKYEQFRCRHEKTRVIVGGTRCLNCGKEFLK